MDKRSVIKEKRHAFFTLNKQFSLVVILAIIASYFILIVTFLLLEPVLNRFNPMFNKINESLSLIGKELYNMAEEPNWIIENEEEIPEINEITAKYPQYNFDYETFMNIDRETFEIKGMMNESKVSDNSYTAIVLEADNAIVVVGVNVPFVTRFGAVVSVISIVMYLVALLCIIGFYVSRKVRYLKTITRNLEYMAGGDLSIKIPLKGRDEIYQVACHINDMTCALQAEIQKEKEAEETKKQLITNISHDLRTPLTAILGYLSILDSIDLDGNKEKAMQYIHRAYEKSEGLSHLVDQLFDYVLLSNQQMSFRLEEVEPSVYFLQLFTELEVLLEKKELQLKYSLEHSLQPILIDCGQFKRVVENIGQNLLKYASDKSMITIEGYIGNREYILIISNDTRELCYGESDFLRRYFTTDRTSGKSAGLGLAICKELVEQQNGRFKVDVSGTVFQVIIALPVVENTVTSAELRKL